MSADSLPPDASPLFRFMADLTRAHANELIISRTPPLFPKPEIVLDANQRAAEIEETFTEGRLRRHKANRTHSS